MNTRASTSAPRAVGLLLALGSALACTAILKPDDKVTRCGNPDDCEPTGDDRYVPLCQHDEAHADADGSTYDKICVAGFKPGVTCDEMALISQTTHPITVAFADAACLSLSCADENKGRLGCPTDGGVCHEGSVQMFNEFSYCGDDEIIAGFVLQDDLEGQHIRDQYCKSYFCDEDFVCGPSGNCQQCDDDDFGEGGCGIVYKDGAPAPTYILGDALEQQCAAPNIEIDDPLIGEC